jgi:hypothetical protein
MNVRSGTLIDIELLRDEFNAAIESSFRKAKPVFQTDEGTADLSDVERSGSAAQGEAANNLRLGKRQQDSIRAQRQSLAIQT